jgi:hypothetical protein
MKRLLRRSCMILGLDALFLLQNILGPGELWLYHQQYHIIPRTEVAAINMHGPATFSGTRTWLIK